MPLGRVCRVLVKFKEGYLTDYEDRVVCNNLIRRKSHVLLREETLGDILGKFYQEPKFSQIENVIQTALKIGSIEQLIKKTNSMVSSEIITLEK